MGSVVLPEMNFFLFGKCQFEQKKIHSELIQIALKSVVACVLVSLQHDLYSLGFGFFHLPLGVSFDHIYIIAINNYIYQFPHV